MSKIIETVAPAEAMEARNPTVRNLAKPFSIGGFIVGEILMLFTVLAPNMKGAATAPWDVQVTRVIAGSIFFGPFGAAAGMGIGLLVTGVLSMLHRRRKAGATIPIEKGPLEGV